MAGLFDLIAQQTMATTNPQTGMPSQQQQMQSGLGTVLAGGLQGIAPMMGRTSQPVSMGQVLAAAGGGLSGGMQQARQQNMAQQQAAMQRQLVQEKLQAAQAARSAATTQSQAFNAYAKKHNLPEGMPAQFYLDHQKSLNRKLTPGVDVPFSPEVQKQLVEQAAATAGAKAEAQAVVEKKAKASESAKTYKTFETAMTNLENALGNADVGALEGRLPAVSANNQIADGAVATMAPVLKQIFRQAGEGTFTDKDQEMLLNMVPTRVDEPEARKEKIRMIKEIVKSKLDIANADKGDGGSDGTTGPTIEMPDGSLSVPVGTTLQTSPGVTVKRTR